MPSPVSALTGCSEWNVAEPRGVLHLLGDVPRLEPVDLVQRDHDRHAEREDALGDEAVARADPLARREHEQHGVDSSSDWSTVRCIRSVSASRGRWKPGRSASTSW